jgi:hypothetical protein
MRRHHPKASEKFPNGLHGIPPAWFLATQLIFVVLPKEDDMDTTTLLIIIILVLLIFAGGWYGRGRWY